jgi:two-component system, OmpR family, sensor histidine kinase KdpD
MRRQSVSLMRLTLALLLIVGITAVCVALPINASTAGFGYLIAVLAVATVWGLKEAILASFSAMLCYNYFFFPPLGRFTIADPQNWVALFAFLVTALVGSQLSDRVRKQAIEAKRGQRETEQLYALSRAILLTDATQPIGAQAAQHIARIYGASGVVLYDAGGGEVFRGGADEMPGIESILKQAVLQGTHLRADSVGADVWPIALGGRPIGALAIVGVDISDGAIQALLNLVAIALERVHTEQAANQAEVARQNEEFKSTLLDAIAHEFKTPLTSIKAAATSLVASREQIGAGLRDMASIIDEETDRLSLLVTEAVKMSEIDAGKVKLDRSIVPIGSLMRLAAESFRGRGEERIRTSECSGEAQRVFVDAEMITLALRQLIDNGLKYSPPDSPVLLRADLRADRVVIRVIDEGPGVPERDRERIFDKFFRRSNVRDKVPGSGLGLHIAREIARTHGGELWVEAGPDAGSQFCLALPRRSEETA